MKWFNKLCDPAKFYLILSLISYSLILLQNIGNHSKFTLGTYSCHHSSPGLFLVGQALYIALWTFLLNFICKWNPAISWVIVLFPFLLFFILLGLVLFQGMEGFHGAGDLPNVTI
jgi:hypothetical protein